MYAPWWPVGVEEQVHSFLTSTLDEGKWASRRGRLNPRESPPRIHLFKHINPLLYPLPWRRMQHVHIKGWCLSTKLYGGIFQKAVNLTVRAVRIWNHRHIVTFLFPNGPLHVTARDPQHTLFGYCHSVRCLDSCHHYCLQDIACQYTMFWQITSWLYFRY